MKIHRSDAEEVAALHSVVRFSCWSQIMLLVKDRAEVRK